MDIKNKNQGFTIVELLIVVVVIAILAAITIVSYNGITNRANASAAQSASASVQKKAEAYNAENSQYPATFSVLTSASSSASWYLTGVNESTTLTSTNGKNTITYRPCGVAASGTTAPANYAAISVYTGAEVSYFTFNGSATTTIDVGQVDGNYLVGADNRAVACFHN
jgi:prepilin-type N-terminal cleavage/methylation domain-containing protein